MSDADRFADLPSGLRICYRVEGPDDGEPLLLVAGLSLDLTSWPQPMVDGFTRAGFRVVRFDNRDVGRSGRVGAPPPGMLRQLLARPRRDAYDLGDMAADTVGLLDALGIGRAHLVGMSMGGMIAQTVAARHPDRVATLTSIFSTTGHRKVGRPARSTLLRMGRRPARTVERFAEDHLAMLRHIGGPGFPPDDDAERAWATAVWTRGDGAHAAPGVARQIGAIQASGDRTAELRRITAPTLVVHGDVDRMVHPSGGRATAEAIPGARHVEIAGMGHHLAPGVVDRLVALTTDLARSTGVRLRADEGRGPWGTTTSSPAPAAVRRASWAFDRLGGGVPMGTRSALVVLVVTMVALVVGVDVTLFRHDVWARLMANVGIVLLAGAVYLRFLRPS